MVKLLVFYEVTYLIKHKILKVHNLKLGKKIILLIGKLC